LYVSSEQSRPIGSWCREDDMSELRQAVENGVEPLQKGWLDHDEADVRPAELVAKNVAGVVGVDRHVDGAELDGAEPGIDEFKAVGRHDSDFGAVPHAERGESVGNTVGQPVDVPERSLQRAKLEECAVAVTVRGCAQKPAEHEVALCEIAHGGPPDWSQPTAGFHGVPAAPRRTHRGVRCAGREHVMIVVYNLNI